MGFDFSKNIPKQFNKIKVPEGYEWEVHNLHAYAEKKKAFAEGKITRTQLVLLDSRCQMIGLTKLVLI